MRRKILMKKLFLSISKGEPLRFLGHLDLLRTMERAVIRSGVPVAFSEGFNPHMKIAFDAALAVGVTAEPLYMEMKLEKDMTPDEVKEKLTPQLPKGIIIYDIKDAEDSIGNLVTFLTEDVYEMEGPVTDNGEIDKVQENIQKFNDLDTFIYQRVTPKKVREMDVKPMIIQPMKVRIEGNRAYLTFSLIRSQSGTVQPKDIWKLLAESFHMPWTVGEFICSRTGAYRLEGNTRITPFTKIEK